MVDATWIAVQPISSGRAPAADDGAGPPTFEQAQYDIVLRRQRRRPPGGSSLKPTSVPSRFLNLSSDFEFAGWGGVQSLALDAPDIDAGEKVARDARGEQILGQFLASGVAGNAIFGGVFYTLPAVVAVASVYSPISLFIAPLTIFLWRPIMEELASALPISGAPYTYILNVSTKGVALVGASLLLLDFASTTVVSAATASAYLAGEVILPFPVFLGAIFIFLIFSAISLAGIKENTRFASGVLMFHAATMIALAVASAVQWGRVGNAQLRENWHAGGKTIPADIARQIFNGFCIGILGLTGFECTPSFISKVKPGRFPLVLRNLHYPAIVLDSTMMLLVLALVPLEMILQGANVLSILAQVAAGRWLRIWIVIDAIIVLCGGVLTGIVSACELLEKLALDRIIPSMFLRVIPATGSRYLAVLCFIVFSGVLYASAGASLVILSKMFSIAWLTVMSLFPITLLLLRFNRPRLPRQPHTSLVVILGAVAVSITVFVGNVAMDPTTVGYFAAYFISIVAVFSVTQNKTHLLRWVYWTYDQYPVLHHCALTKMWGARLIHWMTRLKRQPCCILVKTDEINHLFHMILYVRQNEETSCLKVVHFHAGEKGAPSELEANAKILDEAFPEITIDLVLVQGNFDPVTVAALAHRLKIPRSLMFMNCPSVDFPYSVAELGTRIISM